MSPKLHEQLGLSEEETALELSHKRQRKWRSTYEHRGSIYNGFLKFLTCLDRSHLQTVNVNGESPTAAIQWEDQGVEWVDFELSCDCDIEDTAPYPCIRFRR